MNKARTAVIGCGHLGRIHARLLRQQPEAELAAVVDPSPAARAQAAEECGVPAFADHHELLDKIDAALVVTPTAQHHAVALDLLRWGVHVFVEKPLTLNSADADELIAAADVQGLVLQVGHVERFNPALVAARPQLRHPKYIEAVRAGGYTCRSIDVGVVLDLMIHDLDIILSLVSSELTRVEALGVAVFGPNEDLAQARLTFACGCVANLSASRVSPVAQRTMQVFTERGWAGLDFGAKQARAIEPSLAVREGTIDVAALSTAERNQLKERLFVDYLPLRELPVTDVNAIEQEQREFFAAIHRGEPVQVTGRAGRAALEAAERILAAIATHRWSADLTGPVGPQREAPAHVLQGPHWQHVRQPTQRRAG